MNRSGMERTMSWASMVRVMVTGLIMLFVLAGAGATDVAARESGSSQNKLSPLATFNATFDSNPGLPADFFDETLAGVQFDFTFTADGDGGAGQGFAFETAYGEEDSSSINLQSGASNLSTTERATIRRNDGQNFTFSSLFVNNTSGETVTIAGYDDGVAVGTPQTVATGASGTFTFGEIVVDEVRLTSTDFWQTNIDSFAGDTVAPTAVRVNRFSATGGQGMQAAWFVLMGLVTSGVIASGRLLFPALRGRRAAGKQADTR